MQRMFGVLRFVADYVAIIIVVLVFLFGVLLRACFRCCCGGRARSAPKPKTN